MNMLNSILAAGSDASFWMPEQASTVAAEVDWLFYLILYICYFFFFLIVVMMLGFVFKYRHRKDQPDHPAPAGHSLALEMLWTIPPTIIVLYIAFMGFKGYINMSVAPPNSYEIMVTGQMWSWQFQYPDGTQSSELHVPVNQPIRIVLQSNDVIHALYMPHFRVKKDCVPGRFNKFWFEATMAKADQQPDGSWKGYPIYCAEYCGDSHSEMLSQVIVHPSREAFDEWLRVEGDWEPRKLPQERGAQLWKNLCSSCHTVDGSTGTGPTWKDMYGRDEAMVDGSKILVDEQYILESIRYPQKHIVAGYGNQMNAFTSTQLPDKDIGALIWYMKSLSKNYQGALPDKPLKAAGDAATQPAAQQAGTPPASGGSGQH